ncbi:MAG TPA: ABC transporter permease [Steroidobacteraceae bacterium]|jgi:phospholipid/cholesterol/gamma-HCH transport system permease protein
MYLSPRRNGDNLEVELSGSWRGSELPAIDAELGAVSLDGVAALRVRVPDTVPMDLAGAWRLRDWLEAAGHAGVSVSFEGTRPAQFDLIDASFTGKRRGPPASSSESKFEPVSALGRHVTRRWVSLLLALDFIGRTTSTALRASTSWRRMRPISIARHVYETGITAIPIVSLIAFLITLIIAYIAAQQAREYGAEIFVVDIVTVGVLRELAVLLTAIIVAGRSGSAFAAEIGSMKLNEEVDALHAIGVPPHEVLIVPRVIGLVIALPLLTVIADFIGLTGGALLCKWLLDMPLPLYLDRVQDAIAPTTFWVGIIKAPVFGLLIALSGTYRGLQVRDSSRELGRLTTVAVVQSIFLVIFANAMFAVIFWQLDI